TVQCETTTDEIHSMLQHAQENNFIKAVVGWADFTSSEIEKELSYFSQFELLKGFRHVVQAEPDDRFLLREDFCKGIAHLSNYNFTYDILIFPHQLPRAIEFTRMFPNQPFVLDHIAKPNIAKQEKAPWGKYIAELAKAENVFCKLSGMVTEASWQGWKQEDYLPYIETVFNAFGTKRIMFGSDWPVCRLAASYDEVCGIAQHYVSKLSQDEQADFWGNNAVKFYNLK
ncbi:MAG TPA: amidohydrolase family protein, partial [Panacibacter sp.]|nr:amidohydrolase family protein [Panacibacter sp.]